SRRLTLHPGFRRRGMQARLGAGPRPDALEPGVHILHRRIEWLIDAAAEVERAIQNDVGDGEPIARDVILALEQLVEPLELVLHDRLQTGGRLGQNAHPILEHLQSLGIAEAVVEMLGDQQLDAALPLAGLGAFLGGGADERGRRMFLFEVFPNRDSLADTLAVVELERRHLSAGIGSKSVIELHGRLPREKWTCERGLYNRSLKSGNPKYGACCAGMKRSCR